MQECSWVRDEMKCRFCGGIVNLTDSVCSHCGKEHPLGKKYNADMKKYQERTDAADARVMTSQSYTAKVYVRGIYIIILLAVFLGLAVYMTVIGITKIIMDFIIIVIILKSPAGQTDHFFHIIHR